MVFSIYILGICIENENEKKSDREKELADKEKQIQEMLTPSFTIQELTSAVALILMLAWAGMWVWEAFFAPTQEEIERQELIDRIQEQYGN